MPSQPNLHGGGSLVKGPKPASPPSPPSPASPPAPESPAKEADPAGDYYADPEAYWRDQGAYMIQPWDPIADASPPQKRAEEALITIMDYFVPTKSDNDPEFTIFEVGCGRGRLAHLFHRTWPLSQYYAIDVGPLQTEETQRLVPTANVFTSSWQRFDLDPLINHYGWPEEYDFVVSSEVMMHIKPDEIQASVGKLLTLLAPKGSLVLVEWVPVWGQERPLDAPHNFPHDYEKIIRQAGAHIVIAHRTDLQVIYLAQQ